MKRYNFLPLVVAMALSAIACEKEQAEIQIVPSDNQEKVYVSFQAFGEDTKTVLDFGDETSNVKWEDSDCVAVFDGTAKNEFTIKDGTNTGASAVFEGMVTDGATSLYAVYPSSAAVSLTSGTIRLNVPSQQQIASKACADYSALVEVGSAERNQPMAFKQVCGLLKITIASADVQEIRLNGSKLAGTADVDANGELQSVADPSDEVVLTHEDGLFPVGTYYAAVLPGTTPAGIFSIKLVKIGRTGSKTASSAVTFQRRKGIDAGLLNDLVYKVTIHDMPELFSWNANRDPNEISDVEIVADIDMEMEPWVPKDFKGTFDGGGHKLYNLNVQRTSNACFFNTLTGTMKDVVFGSSNGSSYDGSSVIIQENTEDVSGAAWRYVGLVTRLAEGSSMNNVTSFVPVTVSAASTSKTRVGGLVGIVAGAASIIDCVNKGPVTNLAETPIEVGVLGGIVGRTDAPISISDTDNEGTVTVSGEGVNYAAGIIANDGSSSTVTNCSNSGDIIFNSTGAGTIGISAGGIIGEAVGSTVTNCTNIGKITDTYNGEARIGGIIGRATGTSPISVVECVNEATGVISFNPESATKRAFIGGIFGNTPAACTGAITIQGCINNADIDGVNEQVAAIGGVAGYLNGKGVVSIRACTNNGDMTNSNGAAKNGSSAAEAFIGGIVSFITSSLPAGSSIEGCYNRGSVMTVNRNIKSMGGIVAVLQSSGAVNIKNCHNYGKVTKNVLARPTCAADYNDNTWYHSIAGIVGKVSLGDGSSIVSCTNHSGADVWVNTAGGGAQVRMAGITGYVIKCPEISSCINEADVTYDNTATGGSYIAVGGVAGHVYKVPVFDSCTNSGNISSNRTQVNRIGGVIGTANNTAVTNCTNSGSVSLDCQVATSNWQSVGGIAGFAEGTGDDALDFRGNVNRGTINAKANTSASRVAVGGVLGMPCTAFNVVDNINYGSVTAINVTSGGTCYVGGVIGQEIEAENVSTISGNKNYGAVDNKTEGSTKAFAGGVFGNFGKASVTDCYSYGPVNGQTAGAVAGKNVATIAATICDAVKVNDVLKAGAADVAAWLCPSNTGTITPTYVAHSDSE